MAYEPYLVTLPVGQPVFNGVKSCVVWADSASDAKLLAAGANGEDGDNNGWAQATATVIEAAADWEGWTLEFVLGDGPNRQVFEYVGQAADTMDDLGDGLAAALVGIYTNTTYTGATNIVNITSAEGVGDRNRTARLHKNGATCALLAVSVSAVGVAASAIDITLPADASIVPTIIPVPA